MSDLGGDLDDLRRARQVADAVLYEGYLLFPYRASATKNRFRWQWGVLVPAAQRALGHPEDAEVTCHVLVRTPASHGHDAVPRVEATARFLRLRHRQMVDAGGAAVEHLDVGGEPVPTWDEGLEHESAPLVVDLAATATDHPYVSVVELDGGREVEVHPGVGAAVRTTEPLRAELRITRQRLDEQVSALSLSVTNLTTWSQPQAPREVVLRHSLVGVHVLLRARAGAEIASAIDPPGWAARWARSHSNRGLHPVLADGPIGSEPSPQAARGSGAQAATVALALPIILSDFPEVAPESLGQSFDATEVDELLALAVLGLTDAEQAEARATDPRAAALLDRTAAMSPDVVERLHGTIRERSPQPRFADPGGNPGSEVQLDPAAAAALGVDRPPAAYLLVRGTRVGVGARVRLRPRRRADAQDLFLDGRIGRVERVVTTDDGEGYVAVTVEGDPAADLHRWYGRFHYFAGDEIDVIDVEEGA